MANFINKLSVGAFLAWLLLFSYDYVARIYKNSLPISQWFVATQLYVPDFNADEPPFILWDRTIKKPFTADWVVNVQAFLPSSKTFNTCYGDGRGSYSPEKALPAEGVTLEWFVGKKCFLLPGKYRLEATWIIHRDGYEDVTVKIASNVFTVK